ncbi:alpha/beta fold hydrolase [Streptomyces sp. NPDC056909]|uniref:alpha/beta fold hydrolase n=1 Tax=Streptomyces sp. NPDC056909 TaxID=3345963 RepID=UPI0036B157B2
MAPTAALLRTVLNTTSYLAPRLAGRAAFAVFRRPAGRSRPRPDELDVLAAARTGRITVNGTSVVTYRWGDGTRPVLLVHGWSSRASRFSRFVTGLCERGYSPVSFDAPGHGDSAGRGVTLLELREAIRQSHAEYGRFEAVVAHSFGVLATFFALRDGVEARRVIAIGGVAEFGHALEGFRARLGLRERIIGELRGHAERTLFRGEPDIWRRLDATYRPEEIDADVLLFHDEDDDMVPLSQARALVQAYGGRPDGGAGVRLVVTRGLGHRRILGDPEVVAAAVDFVRSEQPGPGPRSASEGPVPEGPAAGPRPGSAVL